MSAHQDKNHYWTSLRRVSFWEKVALACSTMSVIFVLSSCHNQGGNSLVSNTSNVGADVGQVIPAPRHGAMTPYTLLRSHTDLAAWVGHQSGYHAGVVLQEGQHVYVGALPEEGTASRTGMMSPATQDRFRRQMMRSLPGVRSVLITTDPHAVAMLRGFANYVQSGGDMHHSMKQFHDTIGRIWPNGTGVSPDRPSASPNMSNLTAPPSGRKIATSTS